MHFHRYRRRHLLLSRSYWVLKLDVCDHYCYTNLALATEAFLDGSYLYT
jgi:hypothetical protein